MISMTLNFSAIMVPPELILHHGISTTDTEGLPGDEGGSIRSEKYHRISYFLRRTYPVQSITSCYLFLHFLGYRLMSYPPPKIFRHAHLPGMLSSLRNNHSRADNVDIYIIAT